MENNKEINIKALKYDIEQKDAVKTIFKHFKNIDLSNDSYHDTNFMYTRFEKVNFENSVLDYCMFMGSKFWDCNLQNADLSYSYLWFSDFSNSDLRGANLSSANYDHEEDIDFEQIEEKIFNRISFKNANLTDANLQYAELSGADFRGAILDNCNMKDTFLYKAIIDKKYKDSDTLILDEDQKEQITWV